MLLDEWKKGGRPRSVFADRLILCQSQNEFFSIASLLLAYTVTRSITSNTRCISY